MIPPKKYKNARLVCFVSAVLFVWYWLNRFISFLINELKVVLVSLSKLLVAESRKGNLPKKLTAESIMFTVRVLGILTKLYIKPSELTIIFIIILFFLFLFIVVRVFGGKNGKK